jgi:hypothetical protein
LADTIISTWQSYSDLYGTVAPMDEVIEEVKVFSRPSLLLFCSYIAIRLQLGIRGEEPPPETHNQLLSKFFSSDIARILIDRSSAAPRPRYVFHRRLLLLVAKLALLHCADDGVDAFQEQERLGLLLLKVNDHFDHRGILFTSDNVDRRTWLLGLIANTLAMKEYASLLCAEIAGFVVVERPTL